LDSLLFSGSTRQLTEVQEDLDHTIKMKVAYFLEDT
jgi:hypothetical protein